ncbi:MAG: sulfur transferase domain-containing protein [Pseudomonadota bacterium]
MPSYRQYARTACLLVGLMLTNWAIADTPSHAAVERVDTLGADLHAVRLGRVIIAGQPSAANLDAAKLLGVTTVINARAPREMRWDEQAYVESMGIDYYSIPISRASDTLDAEALNAITQRIEQGDSVLLHCASGNRVSAWVAVYLVEQHDLTVEDALVIARKTGLTSAGLERRVRRYLTD